VPCGVVVAHRRFGKTVWAVNHLSRDAATCARERPRFAYIAPTFRMARQIAWDYVRHFAGRIPGVAFNASELRCDLPNGGQVRLHGADSPPRRPFASRTWSVSTSSACWPRPRDCRSSLRA